jgi:type IV pilus assembly protein PilY1
MKYTKALNKSLQVLAMVAVTTANLAVSAVNIPNTPLGSTIGAKPMTMLVAGKDHKLFYEAYNDASDIGGGPNNEPDGVLDIRFNPKITYYGLYDSAVCYRYDGPSNIYIPVRAAGIDAICGSAGARWSGNWMNYVTTSRIDALRKVLYGGFREIDTATRTVLRRAYIPQDAHSWGKEYHNVATDGYDISQYTPFALPADSLGSPPNSTRHFFGSLTGNTGISCSTLDTCSNMAPLLRVRTNVGDNRRIWEWASKERPVLNTDLSSGAFPTGTDGVRNYEVRVEVCTTAFRDGCKLYPNGGSPVYKPVGLLHEYGENDAMLFGLLTGSYDKHMSGGRLRKTMSSFAGEVDPVTGIFKTDAPIVNTFNRLRIRGFNQSSDSNEYWKSSPYEDSAKAPTEGQLLDWGNPIGEMLYEATRYFAGKSAPTPSFMGVETRDTEVGLSSVTWDDPYDSTSAAKSPFCSRASFLTISDINPSFDSDSVPGSYFNNFSGDLANLNASALSANITGIEDGGVSSKITGLRFIGQSEGGFDSAPTAKQVNSLGSIRGLAPEDPSKQGSYYSAAVAYFAKTNDLRVAGSTRSDGSSADLKGQQTVDSYVVALSSPLPKIEVTTPNSKRVVTLVPFAKSVAGASINGAKGQYQPTNQIVDFYVESVVNSGPGNQNNGVNGGRYYAEFRISFEDVEQGGDHDMDAIARYVIAANSDDTVSVTVIPTYQAGGIRQLMGYVISGTDRDGVYLVASDEPNSPSYFLSVPSGPTTAPGSLPAGYCDKTVVPAECSSLPTIGQTSYTPFVFKLGSATNPGASLMKDPLWYAAKYGGFINRNNINAPDLPLEWDADGNGVPDTYFLVQNPLKLKDSLKKAFDGILARSSSGGNVIANSTQITTNNFVFQGLYDSAKWSGELVAYPVSQQSGLNLVPSWKTSDPGKIPAWNARKLFYGSVNAGTVTGKTLEWASLSTAEKSLLGGNAAEPVLRYVMGDQTNEIKNSGVLRDRNGTNVLGDIVHSSPFYLEDTDTVFVGTNGGMLHAFKARNTSVLVNGVPVEQADGGKELFAYMPSSMLSKVSALANPAYNENHQYFVDGDIAVSSKAQTTRNYLVGTLGRGGKGLYGLDVTTPDAFTASDVKWEFNEVNNSTDPDLGYMLGAPLIAQLQDGTWAVIVSNGYNSTNAGAALYVINLQTGALIRKIGTGTAYQGNNGLAAPGLRLDSSGRVAAVYAGDLLGNVWKFDLSSNIPLLWGSAFLNATLEPAPFFQARDAGGNIQPITAPVTGIANNVAGDPNNGKYFVHFGTGSYFQQGDPTNTAQQTWYGLIDEGAPIVGRSNLVSRTFSTVTTFSGKRVRSLSTAANNDMSSKSGFLIELPETGERIVSASTYGATSQPIMLTSSAIPVIDVCIPGGKGFINIIDPFSGAQLNQPNLDVNGNGDFTDDQVGGVYFSSFDADIGIPSQSRIIGQLVATGGTGGETGKTVTGFNIPNPPGGGPGAIRGRQSWREIIVD